jgi:mannose-1-phosphate guanylyltransferase
MLLLIGYLGDQVREHCGDGRRYGIPIRYSQEPEPLGTAGALRYAADLLADTFVLLNGDTYIQLDYPDLLAAHERHGTTGTMVLAQPYDPAIPCNVRVEPEGGITRYAKSVLDLELNATDGGVAVFERSLLSHIPDHGPTGLESVVYTSLIALGELSGYVTGGTYYDMGSALGLERLQRVLKPHG